VLIVAGDNIGFGTMGKDSEDDILKMVTEIVSAYVSKNPVPASELPGIIRNVHATLGGIGGDERRGDGALRAARVVPAGAGMGLRAVLYAVASVHDAGISGAAVQR